MNKLIPFLLLLIIGACSEPSVDLNVSISHNQRDLIIKNGDTFDYPNARIEINGKYVSNYNDISAGEEKHISLSDFTDSDGERFDIVKMKPLDLTIGCTLEGDKHGFAYLNW